MKKFTVTPSANRMDMSQWNNFEPSALNAFIRKHNPTFVDVTAEGDDPYDNLTYWKNCSDTAIILLPNKIELKMAFSLNALNADELDLLPHPKLKKYSIIRLWWD